jgi:hypothetical protein
MVSAELEPVTRTFGTTVKDDALVAYATHATSAIVINMPTKDRLADEAKQLGKSYCNNGWQINITVMDTYVAHFIMSQCALQSVEEFFFFSFFFFRAAYYL